MDQQAAPVTFLRAGRYAAIDIGTVTCRMLVADVDEVGRLHELDREYVITNLGEGVDASGVLKPDAMQRVAEVIARYQDMLATYRTSEHSEIAVVAVATSAARDAKNAAEFEALLAGVGVTLSVIPGEREATLSFSGASCDFVGEHIVVVDIGGGSTEVIAGEAGGAPAWSHSFNVGCRRVTEKFLISDPPSETELAAARTWVKSEMRSYFKRMDALHIAPKRLVAVAGTATTVVSIHERMEVYDSSRVHRAIIDRSVLDEVYDQVCSVPLTERRKIVGLDPGRAPVIVAGMIIMQVVLDLAGFHSFTVSESDILHGIILAEAAK